MNSNVERRATLSRGTSATAIYGTVASAIASRHSGRKVLLDVGCGRGELWPFLADQFSAYAGMDAVRYDEIPNQVHR